MAELVALERFIDIVLVVLLIEAVLLLAYRLRTGRGMTPGAVIFNLGSGAGLLLAFRASLTSAGWTWIALCLAVAGLAHVADLWWRARQ